MTKQEFLAMSLPYQLWCKILDYKNDYVGHPFDLIVGINQWSKDGKLWSLKTLGGAKSSFDRALPVLRPLSDLTKEIEHKGEKFVPSLVLFPTDEFEQDAGLPTHFDRAEMYSSEPTSRCLNMCDWLKLIKWHFDIADLISKGEAVDVNTLEENPYK